ncbi:hypothetical protein JSY36_12400 [Bacillus sp. H-16]|uniref:hypothetical protein n=1 Tax=Alteribacter salitolerans TaxID=2912333 RepID=UPI0019652524|nr:hypothetical protein [Alteribacter salitolerans]MBM7096547.1 hypothetical protein [Alteribacter salitolerans]
MEFFLLFLVALITLYVTSHSKSEHRPRLTTVKSERFRLQSPLEQQLYDALTLKGFYVSCHIQCGSTKVPLALEPYRIAVLPPCLSRIKQAFLTQYIRSFGWKVVALRTENIEEAIEHVISGVSGKKQESTAVEQKPS